MTGTRITSLKAPTTESGPMGCEHPQRDGRASLTEERPLRVQRRRTKGWKMPANTVYVGRGSRWGNPYRFGETQVRTPGIHQDWEREGRLHKRSGEQHAFVHPGSTYEAPIITMHQVEDATAEQCVEMYRAYITGTPDRINFRHPPMIEQIKAELAGKNLACWCPVDQACHADLLLEIANGGGS